jgi:gliding motility-associated-like protein
VIDTALGTIVYTPDTLYLGIDTLCYVICDNPPAGGPFCDTAFVYITVQSDNRAPVAVRDTMTLLFNTSGTRDILANDSDPDSVDALTATVITQPSNGSVLLASGMATYTPNPTFVGTDSFHYALCDNGYLRLCDSAYAVFTVLPPNELVIPNGFSPNGDGINDFLEIEAILLFPDNTLSIFNRWGSQVFEANGYHNEWGGTFNDNPVPDGTYFFRLDPGNGTSVLTGFILVYR